METKDPKDLRIEQLEAQIAELTKVPAVESGVLRSVASKVGTTLVDSGKARLAAEASHRMVEVGRRMLGDRVPEGRVWDAALAYALPVAVLFGTEYLATVDHRMVPKGLLQSVNAGASLALEGVSQEAVDLAVTAALPMLGELAQLGAGLVQAQLDAGEQPLLESPTLESVPKVAVGSEGVGT